MRNGFPDDEAEFNYLMREVDQRLSSLGYSIHQRPINALGEISKRFSIPLPITKPKSEFQHDSISYWPVSERIYKWYKLQYGDRLKVDPSLGRMVILIEEDMWLMKFPRIFGTVSFTVSRTIISDRMRTDGSPVVFNVVDAIENLPKSRVATLPDNELEHILEKFILGYEAFGILTASSGYELVKLAMADIFVAAEHLLGQHKNYGQSKWSSLQAAEKLFKAAISSAGGNYSNTHNLEKLSRQAESVKIKSDYHSLIPYIKCTPGIRYGEEVCDRDSALLAHHATIGLVTMLKNGGAPFITNVSPQPFR